MFSDQCEYKMTFALKWKISISQKSWYDLSALALGRHTAGNESAF